MAMEINGAAVLVAIAKGPAAFAMGEAHVNALAMATLIARFRDKTLDLDHVKSMARAIGAADFRLALDHLAGKDVAAFSKRLDPKHPEQRTATEAWHREQIWRLADGIVEPVPVSARVPGKRASPAGGGGSKTGEVMKSKALKPKSDPKTAKPRSAKKS